MSQQITKKICIRSFKGTGESLREVYEETIQYLRTLGFSETPLISVEEEGRLYYNTLLSFREEKVFLEVKREGPEEEINLVFHDLVVGFIYDILLMRFNQMAKDKGDHLFVYND